MTLQTVQQPNIPQFDTTWLDRQNYLVKDLPISAQEWYIKYPGLVYPGPGKAEQSSAVWGYQMNEDFLADQTPENRAFFEGFKRYDFSIDKLFFNLKTNMTPVIKQMPLGFYFFVIVGSLLLARKLPN